MLFKIVLQKNERFYVADKHYVENIYLFSDFHLEIFAYECFKLNRKCTKNIFVFK